MAMATASVSIGACGNIAADTNDNTQQAQQDGSENSSDAVCKVTLKVNTFEVASTSNNPYRPVHTSQKQVQLDAQGRAVTLDVEKFVLNDAGRHVQSYVHWQIAYDTYGRRLKVVETDLAATEGEGPVTYEFSYADIPSYDAGENATLGQLFQGEHMVEESIQITSPWSMNRITRNYYLAPMDNVAGQKQMPTYADFAFQTVDEVPTVAKNNKGQLINLAKNNAVEDTHVLYHLNTTKVSNNFAGGETLPFLRFPKELTDGAVVTYDGNDRTVSVAIESVASPTEQRLTGVNCQELVKTSPEFDSCVGLFPNTAYDTCLFSARDPFGVTPVRW